MNPKNMYLIVCNYTLAVTSSVAGSLSINRSSGSQRKRNCKCLLFKQSIHSSSRRRNSVKTFRTYIDLYNCAIDYGGSYIIPDPDPSSCRRKRKAFLDQNRLVRRGKHFKLIRCIQSIQNQNHTNDFSQISFSYRKNSKPCCIYIKKQHIFSVWPI